MIPRFPNILGSLVSKLVKVECWILVFLKIVFVKDYELEFLDFS